MVHVTNNKRATFLYIIPSLLYHNLQDCALIYSVKMSQTNEKDKPNTQLLAVCFPLKISAGVLTRDASALRALWRME